MAVDLLAFGYDPRNCAQTTTNSYTGCLGIGRQRILEDNRVQLIGFAIEVEIGAGEIGCHQWSSAFGHFCIQQVYVGVLGVAQLEFRQAAGIFEIPSVTPSRVWRAENEGRQLLFGPFDPKRNIQHFCGLK